MVTDWMLSVCTDTALAHSTNPEVFTLAVNFLDRFLSVCRWDIVRDTEIFGFFCVKKHLFAL